MNCITSNSSCSRGEGGRGEGGGGRGEGAAKIEGRAFFHAKLE